MGLFPRCINQLVMYSNAAGRIPKQEENKIAIKVLVVLCIQIQLCLLLFPLLLLPSPFPPGWLVSWPAAVVWNINISSTTTMFSAQIIKCQPPTCLAFSSSPDAGTDETPPPAGNYKLLTTSSPPPFPRSCTTNCKLSHPNGVTISIRYNFNYSPISIANHPQSTTCLCLSR